MIIDRVKKKDYIIGAEFLDMLIEKAGLDCIEEHREGLIYTDDEGELYGVSNHGFKLVGNEYIPTKTGLLERQTRAAEKMAKEIVKMSQAVALCKAKDYQQRDENLRKTKKE